jgi:hypothetical protein
MPELDPLFVIIIAGFQDLANLTGYTFRVKGSDVLDIARDIRRREVERN